MIAPSTPSAPGGQVTADRHTGHTAGRDHLRVGPCAHVAQQGQVRALEHAVLADIRDHVARASPPVQPVEHSHRSPPSVVTAGEQPVAAEVIRSPGRRRSARRARRSPARTAVGVLQRRRAQFTLAQPWPAPRPAIVVADARTARPAPRACAPPTPAAARCYAPRRRIEIDQVHPLGAAVLPGECASSGFAVVSLEPAAPCTKRTALPSATSTAGSSVKLTGAP